MSERADGRENVLDRVNGLVALAQHGPSVGRLDLLEPGGDFRRARKVGPAEDHPAAGRCRPEGDGHGCAGVESRPAEGDVALNRSPSHGHLASRQALRAG